MPSINDYRNKFPSLRALDDNALIQRVAEVQGVDQQDVIAHMGYKPPKEGLMRQAGDLALGFGQGAVQGVRMLSDVAGADNPVSGGLRTAEDFIGGLQSAGAKRDRAEITRILQEAEGAGVLDQVIAGVKAFGVAPGQMIAQAAGTMAPTVAAAMVPGGQALLAGRLAPAAVGAAQGVGNIKGNIYEEVNRGLTDAGAGKEEAAQAASQAQSYTGPNTGQIALGGALGALAGSSGAERAVQSLMQGARNAVPGAARRTIGGAAAEAGPEALQGGQEKYATNTALVNEGFNVDPMTGVYSSATMEGLAGGLMGGALGIAKPRIQVDQGLQELQSARTADEAIAGAMKATSVPLLPAPATKTDWEVVDGQQMLTGPQAATTPQPMPLMQLANQQGRQTLMADERGNVAPLPATVRADAVSRDNMARADAEAAAAAKSQRREILSKQTPRGEAPADKLPVGEATPVENIPTGDATDWEFVPFGQATELQAELIEPQDLTTGDGQPYGTVSGAVIRARREGLPRESVVAVPGGWVVRPQPTTMGPSGQQVQPNNTRGTVARDILKDSDVNQPGVAATTGLANGSAAGPGDNFGGSGRADVLDNDGNGGMDAASTAPTPSSGTAGSAGVAGKPDAPLAKAPKLGSSSDLFARVWAQRQANQQAAGGKNAPEPTLRQRAEAMRAGNAQDKAAGQAAADTAAETGSGAGAVKAGGVAQRRKLEADYSVRASEVLEEVSRRGELPKLFRAFAGVRSIDGFTNLAIDEQASAYADYIEAGAKPVTFKESYNDRVMRMEKEAVTRRLQSDREVTQANGKPFKTEASAQAFQRENGLEDTHALRAKDGGFILAQRSPAEQADRKRQAAGLPSYAEAQEIVDGEMGLTEGPDGNIQATDEQFSERDRRITALMKGQPATPFQPQAQAGTTAEAPTVYKTRRAAEEAKAGNTQRIRKTKDGYILREATDKELAAAEKAGKRLANSGVDVEKDSLLAAIAKLGGISMAERSDTIGEGNRNIGGKMLFRNGGLPLDDMARNVLREYGYTPAQEVERDGGVRWLRDAIKSEFMGNAQHFSEEGVEAIMQRERAQQEAEWLASQDAEDIFGDFTADDLRVSGYTAASPEIQAMTEKLVAESEALGVDVETIRERVSMQTEGKTQDEYEFAVQQALIEAIERTRSDAARSDAGTAPGSGEDRGQTVDRQGQEEWLTVYDKTLAETEQRAQNFGQAKIEEETRSKLAGMILGRDFGESIEAFFERKPSLAEKRRAYKDWLDGKSPAPALSLQTQDSESLRAKTERETRAAADDAKEQKRLADKAKADAEVGDFVLTGSDRPADVGAAMGQDSILDAQDPAPQALADNPAAEVQAPKGATKIADFGEKLEGARKGYATKLKDAESVDITAEPLSKSWPEPDYEKLLAGGADPYSVAFVRAARDEVPTKPQKAWKLKGWVYSVEVLRGASSKLLSGEVSKDRVQGLLENDAFRNVREIVGSRAELYELVGHKQSLKGISFAKNQYMMYKGEKDVTKWVVEQKTKATAFSNWPRELAVADTKAAMLDQFMARFMASTLGDDGTPAPKAPNKGQFSIYRKRGTPGAFIGKKIGREYIDLHKADDVAAARKYLEERTADLEAALAKYKETPFERKTENQPRVGDDHRNGAPVTPEVFADTLGFRGVQFGNYVEQGRRQSDLNQAFDALMDMAAVLGVPPRAISLNGRLGLAFGARGRGGNNAPAAHYEPGNVVINLTKGSGPGSLGHEWWHAVDNYFGNEFGAGGFATDGVRTDRLREEMKAAFKSVMVATQAPPLRRRAAELDKRRSKPYWNTPLELSARAYESYLIAKLQDQGAANDYLANVVDEKVWNISESARATFFGGDPNVETYPYPGQAELPAVRAAFDDFFRIVETRTDDAGNVALYSRESLNAKAMFSATAYDDGSDGTPSQALSDATEILGYDIRVPVRKVSMPDRLDMPMRYNLTTRTIEYNTAVQRGRAADVEYMLEELLHALDHTGGSSTISASNDKFLPGGEFRAELEDSPSAALRDHLRYPLEETGYTDTQVAAELFARVGVLYHGNPELLKAAAPNTYAAYEQAFGRAGSASSLRGETRPATGRIAGGQVLPVAAAEVRGSDGRGAGVPDGAAGSDEQQQSLRLRILRRAVQRGIGGELSGSQVDFGGNSATLETRIGAALTGKKQEPPDWINTGSAALKSAASKIDTYAPSKTITEKARAMSVGWQDKLVQGLFDAYAPLKKLSMDAYIAARMTKSADGAFEGMLMHGKPKMTADGGITGDLDGKGFLGVMRELNGEHDRFFMWLAGNRAERLLSEGKENLFTADEIAEMKALNSGQMKDGKPRTLAFAKALGEFNAYSKSVLDVAEQSGLIDGESRKLWEHDFYVPFYRLSQENEISGPTKIKGLVRQKAFEKLKGGKENLGDLMDNTLRNWSHLLSASLANVAASKSLQAAERAGVAIEAKETQAKEIAKATGLKGNATYFMDGGEQRWFVVEDQAVLQAVSALEAPALNGLPLQLMGKFKKYLTIGVTISPAFKVRNLIRDTLAAPAANEMSFNIAKNLAQGWKATDTKTSGYAQMLFSGGLMKFGTYLEGDRAEHVKRLIADGVDDKTILNTPEKVKAMFGKAWDAWQGFGDRMENVNRTALYQQLLDKGLSPRDAAFQARDMMDFSLQGSWAATRTLTAVVPFLNARMQGLYKLGRAAKEDPKRMGYMVAAVSLASITLMLAYGDDDDWKAREDWDRDGFWWFKVGDTAFRIPKPFEIGAMGTIAERSLELMISDDMTGDRFAERMKQMVMGTFAMNPVPQMFKPMLDLYANKDSFTGRQIETLGMERLSKPERYGPNTSALAKALGSAGDYTGVSPVQVDHMIRAYFGWLGTMGTATVDTMVSPLSDEVRPASKLDDYFGGFVKELPQASSRYLEDFYKQAKETSEAMADLRRAREAGDMEKAASIMEDSGSKIAQYKMYQRAEKQLADLNKRVRLVRASTDMDADAKRARIDDLTQLRNLVARQVTDQARARKAALL